MNDLCVHARKQPFEYLHQSDKTTRSDSYYKLFEGGHFENMLNTSKMETKYEYFIYIKFTIISTTN